MYIPPAFRVEDASKLAAFIQHHSFATLVTHDGHAPFASHLPMLLHPEAGAHGTLVAHMARANPQWQHFDAVSEVLAIFHGPHSYISPSWYRTDRAVPTWNYAMVHAYGVPRLITDPVLVNSLLQETVSAYEAGFRQPWPETISADYQNQLIKGIVAFDIRITRLEGKFKLGQNRSPADIQGVFKALSSAEDSDSRALAEMMLLECNVSQENQIDEIGRPILSTKPPPP